MKILLLDIETAPNTAYVWGLYKESVPLARLIETGYVMCWAAKWLHEDEVYFDSIMHSKHKKMLKGIHKLLDEADVVVHFNGRSFDIPTLNREFVTANMDPPSPYKQVDVLLEARRKFRFTSNKLDHIAQKLGCGTKHDTSFELWVKCMQKDRAAWKKMQAYNEQDVLVLERVYLKLRPWMDGHPNHGFYSGEVVCPKCGSESLQRRGVARNSVGVYSRLQCRSCGAWSRDAVQAMPLDQRRRLLRSAA